jgi:hypothetical protein
MQEDDRDVRQQNSEAGVMWCLQSEDGAQGVERACLDGQGICHL